MADPRQQALAQLDKWDKQGYQPSVWGSVTPKQVKKQTRGRGGTLSSLISELSGAGGAAGGAALGTAIAPGPGTLLGAIIGGFAGGTGGRVAENKVRDNRIGIGDALKEGALSGALSGIGTGASVYKGAKAASALKGVAGGAKVQLPQRVGALESAGKNFKAGASGYGIGSTKPGTAPLNSIGSDNVAATLKQLKVPATAPETQARALDYHITNLNDLLSKSYKSSNVSLKPAEVKAIQKNVQSRIAKELDVGAEGKNFAKQQLTRLGKSGDINGLWDFNKSVAKNASFAKNPSSKLVDREAVSRITRDEVKNFLNGKVPGVADKNNLYHSATNARDYILKAAKDVKGGGLVAKVTTTSAFKGGEAKLGASLEKVGQYSAGTAGPVSQVTRQAKLQAPGNLLEATSTPAPESQDPNAGQYNPAQDPAYEAQGGVPIQSPDAMGASGDQLPGDQAQQSPYSLEQALADIQRDPKHASTYESLFSMVDKATQPPKVSAAAEKNNADLSIAGSGLQSIEQAYQFAGGGKGAPGIATHIPLAGQYLAPKAAAYNQTRIEVATQLAKALTGSSRPAQQVIMYYLHSLPNIEDRPQVAQSKLAILNNELRNRTSSSQRAFKTGQIGGASNNDLYSALLQNQGGY